MKIIFLALVLLNLGVLAWHFWVQPAPTATLSVSQPRDALPSEPATASADLPAANDLATAAAGCTEYGPFTDRETLAGTLSSLQQHGPRFSVTSRDVVVTDSYRVFFPPYPTAAAAQEMAARLRAAGVSDIYVVPGGKQENAVSVGVFSDRQRAAHRRQRLQKMGYEPQVEPYTHHRQTDYWIRAETARAVDLLRSTAKHGPSNRSVTDCMRVAASGAKP
ncbi:MAG TPA: SPOR domain-containing protein [Gammaproteobacteria bacterium]|nr:SPOR domain-containing protein [Gammaproteobacteria bacterium]